MVYLFLMYIRMNETIRNLLNDYWYWYDANGNELQVFPTLSKAEQEECIDEVSKFLTEWVSDNSDDLNPDVLEGLPYDLDEATGISLTSGADDELCNIVKSM